MPALSIVLLLNAGCGESWQMDYGQPAAQFLEEDVATKGSAFVGKKITVKGTVVNIDVSNPKAARIHLATGMVCNFGKFKAMAEQFQPGDTIYVDGFLKRCERDYLVMDPAISRDPTAPFTPR